MNHKMLYAILIASALSALAMMNPGGAGAAYGIDYTQSPLSARTCGSCHSGGSYAPTMTIQLLEGGNPVTEYQPGKAYTVRTTITATKGTPGRYGFQIVALQGSDNKGSGTFSNTPSGFRITTINTRQYPEQSSARTSNTFDIAWTAPAAGTGNVRFYGGGIAANGNGGDSGDAAANTASATIIAEKTTTGVKEANLLPVAMTLYPNPVANDLNLHMQVTEAGRYWLRIYDGDGQLIETEEWQLTNGENQKTLVLPALSQGIYAASLSDGKRVKTQTFLKMRN